MADGAVREDMVENGVSFWKHDRVKDTPFNERVSFLRQKGLTQEEKAEVFSKFSRLDNVRAEGHGLGLSIVKRIIERLNGTLGVEDAPGGGCTFWFTLPPDEEER